MYAATKIEKRPVSVRIRQTMSTFRLDGSFQALASKVRGKDASLIIGLFSFAPGSLVLPIRVFRMFQIPYRTATANGRRRCEVIIRGRRAGGPFDRPCVPRIIARQFSFLGRTNNVDGKQ